MSKTTTEEPQMTIGLNNQLAFNNRTGDQVSLSGDFELLDFHKSELFTGHWTETSGHWTVKGDDTTYSFSRVFPQSGRVDFGTATEYDLTNI